ncbi:hypothetical protein GQ43DRAFT_472014 [Delitschia confertaspora ATCC 74209]|uniref:Uncharacterized protein n=1 Tax=Delitschia confertaspora ATCC 74209 TaxID=1513339 RepID=A0A9P4MVI4_9PLEO|nr:hypothetical protein GQ43DRAFT_472014 [Delitschia confertaspora ATCC 74209]
MVLLGGLEIVIGGYLLHRHHKHKNQRIRAQQEEEQRRRPARCHSAPAIVKQHQHQQQQHRQNLNQDQAQGPGGRRPQRKESYAKYGQGGQYAPQMGNQSMVHLGGQHPGQYLVQPRPQHQVHSLPQYQHQYQHQHHLQFQLPPVQPPRPHTSYPLSPQPLITHGSLPSTLYTPSQHPAAQQQQPQYQHPSCPYYNTGLSASAPDLQDYTITAPVALVGGGRHTAGENGEDDPPPPYRP